MIGFMKRAMGAGKLSKDGPILTLPMAEMNDHNPFIPLVSRQGIYGAMSLASPSFLSYCDSSLPSLPFFSSCARLIDITPPIIYIPPYQTSTVTISVSTYRGSSLAVNNVFISIRCTETGSSHLHAAQDRKEKRPPLCSSDRKATRLHLSNNRLTPPPLVLPCL